jgi:hypothetical protein
LYQAGAEFKSSVIKEKATLESRIAYHVAEVAAVIPLWHAVLEMTSRTRVKDSLFLQGEPIETEATLLEVTIR